MDWLFSIFGWFGNAWTRAMSPMDASALILQYREEIERLNQQYHTDMSGLIERISACEKDRSEANADRIKLWQEINRLQSVIAIAEGKKLIGILSCDSTGKIVEVNPAFAAMAGYTCDELLTMGVFRLIPYRYRERHFSSFHLVATGERDLREEPLEGSILTKSGTEIPVSVSLSEWPGVDGSRIFGANVSWR